MSPRDDEGLSLVEVLMAMFLLALLAIAVLPLMIGATRTSVVNEDLAGATAFANAQLAEIRESAVAGCEELQDWDERRIDDPASTDVTAIVSILEECPSTYPAAVPVTVTVGTSATPELVVLSSLILVARAS